MCTQPNRNRAKDTNVELMVEGMYKGAPMQGTTPARVGSYKSFDPFIRL